MDEVVRSAARAVLRVSAHQRPARALLGAGKIREPYKGKVKPTIAHFFGMIANIDENMGRLDAMLKESGLYDNTILIFMTDNGGTCGVPIWNAGMRGRKTEYYDGGHRVPCFIRWPAGGLRQPGDVDDADAVPRPAAHAHRPVRPAASPREAHFDGVSLAPLLRGKPQPELADRKLVVQYGIWEEYLGPTKWNCAVMWGKWRLFRGKALYNIAADPGQKTDVADRASRDRQGAARPLRNMVGADRTAGPGIPAHPSGFRARESRLPGL